MSYRKTFIILGTIIALAGAVAGSAWFYYQKQAKTKNDLLSVPLSLKEVSNNAVLSPAISDNAESLWFFTDRARLYRRSSLGELTEYPLPALAGTFLQAYWPKAEGQGFLVQMTQFGKNLLFYYDKEQGKYKSLSENITNPVWTSDGKRIVFVWKSGDNKSQQLVISNPDGSGYKILTQLPSPDFEIQPSPLGDSVLLIRSHLVANQANPIFQFSFEDGSLRSIVAEGNNASVAWAPDGQSFVFIRDGELMRYDFQSNKVMDLDIKTDKGKFAFDPAGLRYLYAATRGSGKGEKFVRLDLTSSERTDYFVPAEDVLVKDLLASGAGTLYFSDLQKGGFYMISK